MNFEDEPYVRVFKRRTTTMAVVGWQARAVLRELFLVVDRSGVLDLDDEDPADAVTAVLGDVPVEVVRDAIDRLVKKDCVRINGRFLVIPRFQAAQTCKPSQKQLMKRLRLRNRWSRAHYREVYERDGRACRYCGSTGQLTIDHVIPRVHGGSDEPGNLVVACRSCNSRKGKKTPAQAGMVLQ